jgi:hypothetical protein
MRSRIFYSLLIVFFAGACKPKSGKSPGLDELKAQKQHIDSMITEKSIVILAKVEGEKRLVKVEGNKYPPNMEATYNVVKDENGKTVYIAELPFSKNSDWFIAYRSYFDNDGKIFAFQRLNNFLHSECVRGAAMEKSTNYYNRKFKLIDSTYTLTDSQKKPLDRSDCKFPYNFPYKVFKTVGEYKDERGID